jgi:hypothetical protein
LVADPDGTARLVSLELVVCSYDKIAIGSVIRRRLRGWPVAGKNVTDAYPVGSVERAITAPALALTKRRRWPAVALRRDPRGRRPRRPGLQRWTHGTKRVCTRPLMATAGPFRG